MLSFYRKAMSDLPLDKENQQRNASRTPGLNLSWKNKVATASTNTTISTPTTTANNSDHDAARFAASRSPPGSSKVLRKRWKMQFEKQQLAERQQQQSEQQPRLMEKGPVRLAASSPVPMMMVPSSSVDVVMRSSSTIPGADEADLHQPEADSDLVNTTTDSDQSLDLILKPVSARKNCTNPVAMTLLHSDDGMEDVTFLLQHDRDESTAITTGTTPVATRTIRRNNTTPCSSRQSPLTCSARVPVQNVIARPVAARPIRKQQTSPKQQFYQQHQQHQQQQQYYYQQQQQQQQQEQEQYYQQQQQQRPYYQHPYQF
jgi:hypothetical protein